jgi:hypothetical protein
MREPSFLYSGSYPILASVSWTFTYICTVEFPSCRGLFFQCATYRYILTPKTMFAYSPWFSYSNRICMRDANVHVLPVHGSFTLAEFACKTLILGGHILKICKRVAAKFLFCIVKLKFKNRYFCRLDFKQFKCVGRPYFKAMISQTFFLRMSLCRFSSCDFNISGGCLRSQYIKTQIHQQYLELWVWFFLRTLNELNNVKLKNQTTVLTLNFSLLIAALS